MREYSQSIWKSPEHGEKVIDNSVASRLDQAMRRERGRAREEDKEGELMTGMAVLLRSRGRKPMSWRSFRQAAE